MSVQDRVAHAPLQRAAPDGFFLTTAALVVAVVPLRNPVQRLHVRAGFDCAAHVCEEQIVGTLLLRDRIPHLPQVDDALGEFIPVGRRVKVRKILASLAVALRQPTELAAMHW